jgi:hypothetical protein
VPARLAYGDDSELGSKLVERLCAGFPGSVAAAASKFIGGAVAS